MPPSLDPVLDQRSRLYIVSRIAANGGRLPWADIAYERDVFGTPASLTIHNAKLIDAGFIRLEKGARRKTEMILTEAGWKRYAAHRAALLDLIMENTG